MFLPKTLKSVLSRAHNLVEDLEKIVTNLVDKAEEKEEAAIGLHTEAQDQYEEAAHASIVADRIGSLLIVVPEDLAKEIKSLKTGL